MKLFGKKKPKVVQLPESGNAKPVLVIDLAADKDGMLTGDIGGCLVAILLWNPDKKGRYQNMRGQHGSGGMLDWKTLLAGVPNDTGTKLLLFCMKSDVENFKNRTNDAIDEKQIVSDDGKSLAIKPEFFGYPAAFVDRAGAVQEMKEMGYQNNYDVETPVLPRR